MILLRLFNLMFLIGLVACVAGAMAGLIVFAPFVGGAWLLALLAIVGSEPNSAANGKSVEAVSEAASRQWPTEDTNPRDGRSRVRTSDTSYPGERTQKGVRLQG